MKSKVAMFIVVLLLVLAAGHVLRGLKATQRLAPPGVRLAPGAPRGQEVALPEELAGYRVRALPLAKQIEEFLPADTDYGMRMYESGEDFHAQVYVVLMGADRTSIHRPQICLPLQGMAIAKTETVTVPVGGGSIPAVKLTLRNIPGAAGDPTFTGMYLYWFVSDKEIVADASGLRRARTSAARLLRTGELERWAYVSLYTACAEADEAKTFARLQALVADLAPRLLVNLPSGAPAATVAPGQELK